MAGHFGSGSPARITVGLLGLSTGARVAPSDLVRKTRPEVPGVVPGRVPLGGPDAYRSKALAISWACCSACFLLEPVAGDADAGREATCRARLSPRPASA